MRRTPNALADAAVGLLPGRRLCGLPGVLADETELTDAFWVRALLLHDPGSEAPARAHRSNDGVTAMACRIRVAAAKARSARGTLECTAQHSQARCMSAGRHACCRIISRPCERAALLHGPSGVSNSLAYLTKIKLRMVAVMVLHFPPLAGHRAQPAAVPSRMALGQDGRGSQNGGFDPAWAFLGAISPTTWYPQLPKGHQSSQGDGPMR